MESQLPADLDYAAFLSGLKRRIAAARIGAARAVNRGSMRRREVHFGYANVGHTDGLA